MGADLVEFNPDRDVDNLTAVLAAKLMKEIAAKIVLSQRLHRFELEFKEC